jgi:hypothetical protein
MDFPGHEEAIAVLSKAEADLTAPGYRVTELEAACVMAEVLKRIQEFVAPMSGHIGREIMMNTSGNCPSMKISIGFSGPDLKQYMAQGASQGQGTAHTLGAG